jgi:hypothetical protein
MSDRVELSPRCAVLLILFYFLIWNSVLENSATESIRLLKVWSRTESVGQLISNLHKAYQSSSMFHNTRWVNSIDRQTLIAPR